ncbi:hypothetical protein MHYP_G00148710 [Metynnis hypsauchen]
MPPKLHKTPGPSQSLIRPVVQATSTSMSGAACPVEISSNIRIVGIPVGELFTLTTSSASELLKEAFTLDKPPLMERTHHRLAPKPKSGDPLRPIVARLHYYANCVEILRKARHQQRITISNMKLSVFPDFTAKVARARAAFNEVHTQLRAMEGIRYGGKPHDFICPEEAGRFVATLR